MRIDADAAGLGDQFASPESKDSTLVMSVGKRKHGRKPEIGSKGEVRYTEDFDFEFYDPKSGQWGMYLDAITIITTSSQYHSACSISQRPSPRVHRRRCTAGRFW